MLDYSIASINIKNNVNKGLKLIVLFFFELY